MECRIMIYILSALPSSQVSPSFWPMLYFFPVPALYHADA